MGLKELETTEQLNQTELRREAGARRSQAVTRAWVRADGMGPGRRLEVTEVSACGVCPLRISDLNGSSFPAKQSGWSGQPLICFTGLPSANHRALRLFLWFPCNGPILSGNRKGRGRLGAWNPETSPERRRGSIL